MTAVVRDGGQGPQMVPLHRWALKVRLDSEIAGVARLDELGEPRWVAAGALVESDMQFIQPTLDDPYYTFIVEALSEPAACETILQVLARVQGGGNAV